MILEIIKIIVLFFIPANIFLLFIFNFKFDKYFGKYLSFLLAYGIAPLISSLLFFYSIWIFPGESDFFYGIIVISFWFALLIICAKKWKTVLFFYVDFFKKIRKHSFKRSYVAFTVLFFFTLIFSIQALFYPIVDNDNALYLNQSEAIYKYKNLEWQKKKIVIIRGGDEYKYNSAIRPAIPAFMALSFALDNNRHDYFIFKFLSTYYYYLLIGAFLYSVYFLAKEQEKVLLVSLSFAMFFLVLFPGLIRTLILNSKENIIYFLVLLSIYLVYLITVGGSKRKLSTEFILGIILGLNAYINLHGVIIECVILLILFLFSKLSFKERILQVFAILVISFPFAAFEQIVNFNFIFGNTIKNTYAHIGLFLGSIYEWLLSFFSHLHSNDNTKQISQNVAPAIKKVIINNSVANTSIETNKQLYHVNSLVDIYLKGKMQILTNIGMFGFYFWLFLGTLIFYWKKIFNSILGKIIISFIGIYYFVVIDPFNLNRNTFSIILWGSTKYAKLLLLLSLTVTSVYFYDILRSIFDFFSKRVKLSITIISFLLIILVLLKGKVIEYFLKILLLTVSQYKDISFYQQKITNFYFYVIFFLIFLLISFVLLKFKQEKKGWVLFLSSVIWLFILVPFLIIEQGKVPMVKTFSYINNSRENKLKSTLNYANIYNVYFYAKNTIPKGTALKTGFSEIYTYDDHFELTENNSNAVQYEINAKCNNKEEVLFSSNGVNLCKVVN